MLLDRRGDGAPFVADPVAWLKDHDHDRELHQTVSVLLHPPGDLPPRTAEAVLLLEAYIAATATVRARVGGWDGDWPLAVLYLSQFRSMADIKRIQLLLRATTSTERHDR